MKKHILKAIHFGFTKFQFLHECHLEVVELSGARVLYILGTPIKLNQSSDLEIVTAN